MIDQLNSDLLLNIAQYLNVVDAGRFAETSKRFYYLVHHFRILKGPELVTAASWDHNGNNLETKQVMSKAVDKLQSSPNLVLAFNTVLSDLPFEFHELILPKDTVVLGTVSRTIQANCGGEVDCNSNSSLMLANFPSAEIKPFCFKKNKASFECAVESWLEEIEATSVPWKAFLVYGCGSRHEDLEYFISKAQKLYPDATIVGGICSYGYVSQNQPNLTKEELMSKRTKTLVDLNQKLEGRMIRFKDKLELVDHLYEVINSSKYARVPMHVDDAVFGVALGGDVPVRSIVSRGVRSLTQERPTQPSNKLVVQEATFVSPDDDSSDPHRNPFHIVHRIRDTETNRAFSFADLISKIDNLHFIGLQRPGHDGYELHPVYSPLTGSFEIPANVMDDDEDADPSLINANIDFFSVDGRSCVEHMDATLKNLRDQTKGEILLGALMFSSEYRGPYIGENLIPEADASRFANVFPDVPCLGFYAGGEIGPLALAGHNSKIFQTGKAALQGLTTVFALFIAPVVDLSSYHLDDSEQNIFDFAQSRLASPHPKRKALDILLQDYVAGTCIV